MIYYKRIGFSVTMCVEDIMNTWIKEAIFYQIYPLGFCGAPSHHQETTTHAIRTIEEWIPHLKQLHVNALYLGPVFESYAHGYDTSDYHVIDHRLGTNTDFKNLCTRLHKEGIRIVLDGVFNHVGRNFWAFQDVQRNLQNSAYCDWFRNLDFTSQSPLQDPFTYTSWEGHYNLITLNLKNEEVIQYLFDSIAMWIEEFHIDGLRIDAANTIDLDFFRRLRLFCKEKKNDFWLMGEIIHGDYTTWANDKMLDSITNYECYKGIYSSHNDSNYFEIAYSLNRQFGKDGIYRHLILYNFVDNHDVNRLSSTLTNEHDIYNVYTLLYTIPGIPSIYYGSEWAIQGKKHNGNDADLRPHIHLTTMNNSSSSLLAHIQKLGSIKQQLPALSYGGYEQILVRNEQFIFVRKMKTQSVYIALNLSNHPYTCNLFIHAAKVKEYLSDARFELQNDKLTLHMQPKSSYILMSQE